MPRCPSRARRRPPHTGCARTAMRCSCLLRRPKRTEGRQLRRGSCMTSPMRRSDAAGSTCVRRSGRRRRGLTADCPSSMRGESRSQRSCGTASWIDVPSSGSAHASQCVLPSPSAARLCATCQRRRAGSHRPMTCAMMRCKARCSTPGRQFSSCTSRRTAALRLSRHATIAAGSTRVRSLRRIGRHGADSPRRRSSSP